MLYLFLSKYSRILLTNKCESLLESPGKRTLTTDYWRTGRYGKEKDYSNDSIYHASTLSSEFSLLPEIGSADKTKHDNYYAFKSVESKKEIK